MLQRLEFGSSHVYAPQGQSGLSIQSKRLTSRLKNGDPGLIPQYAARALLLTQQGEFPGFFGARTTLVPIPRSSPLVTGGLWVPMLIAQAMQYRGLGREVTPLVRRISPVAKSAFQPAHLRPTVQQHYDSLAADVLAPAPTHIVLIDDVVTRGCTLLAAASRVSEAYPNATIKAFAVIRTMSKTDVDPILSPCVGTIEPYGTWATRRP